MVFDFHGAVVVNGGGAGDDADDGGGDLFPPDHGSVQVSLI